jgi:hypothetical protein
MGAESTAIAKPPEHDVIMASEQPTEVNVDVSPRDLLKNPLQEDLEKVYKHTLEDGREVAGTLEQAIKLCPVLGAMTIENAQATLEDDDVAQRAAERGRAKREAKEQANPSHNSEKADKNISERVKDTKGPDKEIAPEAIIPSPGVERLMKRAPGQIDKEVIPEPAVHIKQQDLVTHVSRVDQKERIALPQEDNEQVLASAMIEAEQPVIKQEFQEDQTIETELRIVPAGDDSLEPTAEISPKTTRKITETEELPIERPRRHSEARPEPNALEVGTSDNELAAPQPEVEGNLDSQEVTMNPLETDEPGTLSTTPESELETPLPLEPDVVEVKDEPAVETELVLTEFPTERFETFVRNQSETIVPQSLESLKASAEDRSLEETLVQLAVYFKESADDAEEQEILPVREMVRSLAKKLPELQLALSTQSESRQPITPELTQKLLDLLRVVGYQNPGEVLVTFVSRHDIEFLLQALRYLSQLTNADYRQEFLPPLLRKPPVADESVSARIGKIIFNLLMKRPEAVEITPTI